MTSLLKRKNKVMIIFCLEGFLFKRIPDISNEVVKLWIETMTLIPETGNDADVEYASFYGTNKNYITAIYYLATLSRTLTVWINSKLQTAERNRSKLSKVWTR